MSRFHDWLSYDEHTGTLTWLKGRNRSKVAGNHNKALGYLQVRVEGRLLYAHRIIMEMVGFTIPRGLVVDHINGDGLDNRLANLRITDSKGNSQNQRDRSSIRLLPRGVIYEPDRRKYRALVGVDGKSVFLGRFDTVEEAAEVSKAKRVALGFLNGSA